MELLCNPTEQYRYKHTHSHTNRKTCRIEWMQTVVFHWLSTLSVLSGRCSPKWPQMEFIKVPSLYTLCCVCHLQVPLLQCSERLLVMVIISIKSIQLIDNLTLVKLNRFSLSPTPTPPSQSPGPVAACKTSWLWGNNKGIFSQAVTGPFTTSWTATCGQKTPFFVCQATSLCLFINH